MTERAPVNLKQFRQKIEAEPLLEIEADGKVFAVRHPAVLTDDEFQLVVGASTNPVPAAKVLLDDYEGYAAAGGTAALLLMILNDQEISVQALQGVGTGESEPS
jgi:hypothetical protein